MVGTITKQQVRVFAKFAIGFLMTAYAYVFAATGDTALALAAALSAFAFIGSVIVEARHS